MHPPGDATGYSIGTYLAESRHIIAAAEHDTQIEREVTDGAGALCIITLISIMAASINIIPGVYVCRSA